MLEPTFKHGTKEHNPMRSEEIIIRLFCMVDDKLAHVNTRKNAHLYPSEIVTIGILFALKGVHSRAFYRWRECGLVALVSAVAGPFALAAVAGHLRLLDRPD